MKAFIENEVLPSINIMNSNGLYPRSFTYPYGVNNEKTDSELLKYFKVLRSTSYSFSFAPFKWGSTKTLPAYGMDYNYNNSLQEIFNWMEYAKTNNQVVVLYGHTPTSNPNREYGTSYDRLRAIIDKARELGLTFYTLSDLSADVGYLTVTFTTNTSTNPQWSLDRKRWYAGREIVTLPLGSYTVMFRNIDNTAPMIVEVKKDATTAVVKAD